MAAILSSVLQARQNSFFQNRIISNHFSENTGSSSFLLPIFKCHFYRTEVTKDSFNLGRIHWTTIHCLQMLQDLASNKHFKRSQHKLFDSSVFLRMGKIYNGETMTESLMCPFWARRTIFLRTLFSKEKNWKYGFILEIFSIVNTFWDTVSRRTTVEISTNIQQPTQTTFPF